MHRIRIKGHKDFKPLEIDKNFLLRVYRTSIWVGIFAFLWIWTYLGRGIALSFSTGAAVSLIFLRALEYAIKKYITPQKKKPKPMILITALIKFPLIVTLFYFLMRSEWLSLAALVVGLGLVQAIIILKAFGIILVNAVNSRSMNREERP